MRIKFLELMALVCFTLFNLNVISCSIESEVYKILSLDNKECAISLETDLAEEILVVRLNDNEMMCISGFKGLEKEVNVLNQKFLELRTVTRGGSGIAMRRYVLICISDDKLIKAIDVLSMISWEFTETYVPSIDSLNLYDERSIYKLIFTVTQHDNNFKLIAIECEKVQSKKDPNKNHETEDLLQFFFDEENKVFYNQKESLNGIYIVDGDNGSLQYSKQFGDEKFPSIKLKNEQYFYINQTWYINDRKDHLTGFSNNCN